MRNDGLDESASRYLEIGQHVLFAVLLVLGTTRASRDGTGGPVVVVAAAGAAFWYLAGAVLGRIHRARTRAATPETATPPRPWSSRAGIIWFAGLIACWSGLLALSGDFSWVAFALFLLAIHMLPTAPALLVVAAMTAVVVAVQLTTGTREAGQIAGPVVGAVVAAGAGLIYRRILAESEHRRRLVADLVAAQDELVALNDELAETQREAGVLAERQRLAHDIHDTLAQGFSSIILLSRAGLAGEETARGPVLRQIEVTAADNLDEARRVVHALAPASLQEAPLPAALGRLLHRQHEQTGIETSLDIDGEVGGLGTAGEVALLRVAQSALSNVRLHSGAARVAVSLTGDTHGVRLDVVDDGCGFDPDHLDTAPLGGAGFGLRAMRERLASLGGTLHVDAAPGEGTTLTASVPFGDADPRRTT